MLYVDSFKCSYQTYFLLISQVNPEWKSVIVLVHLLSFASVLLLVLSLS